jgi:hypothetical protein
MSAIENLITELEAAEKYLSEFSGGWSNEFMSAEEFHAAFKKELTALKKDHKRSLSTFVIWFMPTSEWDDLTNSDSLSTEFGNRIYKLLLESDRN